MNGLIGNRNDAKFIFLGVDDEKDLPSKQMLLKYFPNGTFNTYKSHGHFSSSFHEIEKFYAIKRNGFNADISWDRKKCISHGIRIITNEPPNSFLAIEIGACSVDFLNLSQANMQELKILVDGWEELVRNIKNVLSCVPNLAQSKLTLMKYKLTDSKIELPDEDSITNIFNGYGDNAICEMINRFNIWHQSVLWR